MFAMWCRGMLATHISTHSLWLVKIRMGSTKLIRVPHDLMGPMWILTIQRECVNICVASIYLAMYSRVNFRSSTLLVLRELVSTHTCCCCDSSKTCLNVFLAPLVHLITSLYFLPIYKHTNPRELISVGRDIAYYMQRPGFEPQTLHFSII